jgi:DNA-directed RNA polymerase subunit RPC12/RpoP
MNNKNFNQNELPKSIAQFIGGAMGFIFAGIGVTVLIFVWSESDFGGPPLFFRVFASFIALAFIIVGGSTFIGSLIGITTLNKTTNSFQENPGNQSDADEPVQDTTVSYTCSRCGAPLGQGVEVSPHGDVKCGYCNAWFNIHNS